VKDSKYELPKKIIELFDIQKQPTLFGDIFELYDKLCEMNVAPLDLKPENIMQDIDKNLIIIDGGI
jgi:serine/threonine protein kinase